MKKMTLAFVAVALVGSLCAFTTVKKARMWNNSYEAIKIDASAGRIYLADPDGQTGGFTPVSVVLADRDQEDGYTCNLGAENDKCTATFSVAQTSATWDSSEGAYYVSTTNLVSSEDGVFVDF